MLKIYITDLESYNNGILKGEWVSIPQEQEDLEKKLSSIVEEEYFITDFEWDSIELFNIDQYQNIFKLNKDLQLLEDTQEYYLKSIKFLLQEGICEDISEALENLENVIIYENQTMEDIAYNFVNEYYDLDKYPTIITSHIDYEAIARDLEIEGTYIKIDNDIFEYIG